MFNKSFNKVLIKILTKIIIKNLIKISTKILGTIQNLQTRNYDLPPVPKQIEKLAHLNGVKLEDKKFLRTQSCNVIP